MAGFSSRIFLVPVSSRKHFIHEYGHFSLGDFVIRDIGFHDIGTHAIALDSGQVRISTVSD